MKDKDKKSNVAIWKIDTNIDIFQGSTFDGIIDSIKASEPKRKLDYIPLAVNEYEDKKVKIIQSSRYSEGWAVFLGKLLGDDFNDDKRKEQIFYNSNKDLVLFIYDDQDIYAITSGAGFHIIQKFIDERFPFEVAKRMLTGEFKSAEIRDLTGTVYSQSKNFRRNYNFSRREAFGKVWKKLTGNIDVSILKNSKYLTGFIQAGKRKNFNADIKSSFTFRKSITLDQVIGVVKEIQELLKTTPTDHQKQVFSFLDTLKEVKNKKDRETLKESLFKKIYEFIISSEQVCDFDFCHPKEMIKFLHGTNYKINNDLKWEESPSASDVLIKLRQTSDDFLNKTSFNLFKEKFDRLCMVFQEDDEGEFLDDNLWKYFHGEVEIKNKNYFFIDGKWYEVVGDFLKRLSEDFQDTVFGDKTIISKDIPFIDWTMKDEDGFNKEQAKINNFYYGDKVFLKNSEKGKIELFDLIYNTNGKTFIIQTKDCFSASIRDACSQVQMASEIIENDLVSNSQSELKKYYSEFSKKNNNITWEQFLQIMKQDRCYILAFGTKIEFTKNNFLENKFKSEIARFEILGITHEFKANDREFKISNIKRG